MGARRVFLCIVAVAVCLVLATGKRTTEKLRIALDQYLDAEDFWYDNRDLFPDYTDAEDYYSLFE